jgi:glyoxylase-like metal-dependent hydrolase (beta-lactamase superfamily II)
MRIQKAGTIADQILLLGSRHGSMYLIMGDKYALLGGGVAWEVPRLEAQLDRFQIDRNRIQYLVISHAHHDHCGAVPYLIARYPHIQKIASPYCTHILNKSQPVHLMREVNRKILESLNRPHFHDGISLDFRPLPIERQVADGDRIELGGGLTLRFYLTPGHSRCSLTAYVPELKALFPADALPFPETGKRELTVTANHDYDEYIRSLEKIESLSIRLVGYEHDGVLTGEEAAAIIPKSLAATHDQRHRIRKRYEELQDIDLLVEEVAEQYRSLELFQPVPFDIMRAITKRMVKSALGLIDPSKVNRSPKT